MFEFDKVNLTIRCYNKEDVYKELKRHSISCTISKDGVVIDSYKEFNAACNIVVDIFVNV